MKKSIYKSKISPDYLSFSPLGPSPSLPPPKYTRYTLGCSPLERFMYVLLWANPMGEISESLFYPLFPCLVERPITHRLIAICI